jgi:hypothetical protein
MAGLFTLLTPTADAASLQIGSNFTGSRYGPDSNASPADGDGAVGTNHFVEFINGRYSVYDKATGNRVQTMTDLQFWAAGGITFASTVGISDPRIMYDTTSQRWFASMIDIPVDTRGRQRSNHFLLAVSATSDPTGAWGAFTFAADTNNVNFADFPTLGLDQNGVYLSGDMFDRLGNPYGPLLVSIPKSDLLASTPSITRRQYFGPYTYTSRGDVLQPAVTSGNATSPEICLAVSDLGVDLTTQSPNGPHSTLVLSQIANAATGAATLNNPSVTITVPAYSVPFDPTQPDGSNNLADNDARFAACVRRVGNILYATHATETNNRAAVRWYKINAVNNTVVQSGDITDPNLDLFYPSIAANEAGTVVIGFNGASSSQYVSSYAAMGQMVNGSLSFGPVTLLKAGTGNYQNPDPTGESRWGDYSATTVDPADSTHFWTIQVIAISRTVWETQITELITPGTGSATNSLPSLAVTRDSTEATISWPSTVSGAQLESSPTLGPTAVWTPFGQTPGVTNGVASITIPISSTNTFFRIAMPSSAASSGAGG